MESSFLFESFKCLYGDYVLLWIFWETEFKLAANCRIFYAICIL